jgi:hypothetical protein
MDLRFSSYPPAVGIGEIVGFLQALSLSQKISRLAFVTLLNKPEFELILFSLPVILFFFAMKK